MNLEQAALTTAVIASLAGLRSRSWRTQLVLVDHGSGARDLERLRAGVAEHRNHFDDVVFLDAGRNLGAAAGRNRILERSEGSRILILDNDLELENDLAWLEGLWGDLDDDPSLAIAGPTLVFARYPELVQAAGIGLTRLGRVAYLHRGEPVDAVPRTPVRVLASPAACWLVDRGIQREVGLFPEIYYPMQYWDVDYCMQLHEAGYGVLCDRRHRVRHIVNVTTRAMGDRVFARTAVRHGMIFRERWGHRLEQVADVEDDDVYWGPVPRP